MSTSVESGQAARTDTSPGLWDRWAESAWGRYWLDWQRRVWSELPLSRLFPLDPAEVCRAWAEFSETLAAQPALLDRQISLLALEQLRLGLWAARQLSGDLAPAPLPAPPRDRRFSDEDWDTALPFSVLRQSYQLWSRWLSDTASRLDLDASTRQRVRFYLRQWLDALSPSNFPATNPEVLRETIASAGENLRRGLRNLLADAGQGAISVVPPARFRPGENLALTRGQVVLRNELMELIQYAPATRKTFAVPLLVLPPWINRYYVLDIRPGMSLVEYLVAQGHTVFMVSWRNPDASQSDVGLEDYLRLGALAAMKAAKSITGSRKVNVAGYCIGGTLLGIMLAHLAAKGDGSVASATFLTTLLDFSEVGETAVFIDRQQLAEVQRRMEEKGYLAPEELSAVFRMMRSNDLIWNFVVNNYLLGREPPALDLMHWSVDGTRMPRAMQEYYLYNMYVRNNLSRPGALTLLGTPIDLGRIRCPAYFVAGAEDHIVPWQTAYRSARLVPGAARFVLGRAGHITSVVCPAGGRRNQYMVGDCAQRDADAWLAAHAQPREGSWWPDWVRWLATRSGDKRAPPPIGNRRHPPLMAAPGQYVLEE